MILLEFIVVAYFSAIIISYALLLLFWVVMIVDSNHPHRGFITYKTFKALFESVEWEKPSYSSQYILRKKGDPYGDMDNYEMFPSASSFVFNGKSMLPITPLTLLLIVILIYKHKEHRKMKVKHKTFIWKVDNNE